LISIPENEEHYENEEHHGGENQKLSQLDDVVGNGNFNEHHLTSFTQLTQKLHYFER